MWGFGSALFQDQLVDWRNEFSKWFCNEFKQIKFPSTGNVFSFFIDPETKKFMPWSEKVEKFELDPDMPLQVSYIRYWIVKSDTYLSNDVADYLVKFIFVLIYFSRA